MLRIAAYLFLGLFILLLAAAAIVVFDPFRPAHIRAMTSIRAQFYAPDDLPKDQAKAALDKCLKVADDYPHTLGGVTCLFIAATRLADADEQGVAKQRFAKAIEEEKLDLIADTFVRHVGKTERLKDLAPNLLQRIEKEPDHPRAGQLAAWTCSITFPAENEKPSPLFTTAADLIKDHYAASPDISIFSDALNRAIWISDQWPRQFESHLDAILEKNQDRYVLCSASLAKAQIVANYGEERQDEAEKLFDAFCKKFDGKTEYPYQSIEEGLVHDAQIQLKELRYRALGKPAPLLAGKDLSGKALSLADFKGKTTLLVFWGTWCRPCMKLVPHERELAERFASRKFSILSVNCNDEIDDAKAAAEKHGMTWPILQNELDSGATITQEWKVLGFPTLYLIDHHGIIRRRWVGPPSLDLLDDSIELFVAAADENRPVDQMKEVTDKFAVMIKDAGAATKTETTSGANLDLVAQIATDKRFQTFAEPTGEGKYVIYTPTQRDASSIERLPAILFLHGNGAQGTDGRQQLYQGLAPAILERTRSGKEDFPFIAIFPQAHEGEDWQAKGSGGQRALRILDEAIKNHPIDEQRILLAGFSMGGEGAWSLGAAHANRWAAIIPISHGWKHGAKNAEKLKPLPTWAFHSDADELISATQTRELIAAIQQTGAKPLYTEYSGLTHAQTPKQAFLEEELIAWMLEQRRASQ